MLHFVVELSQHNGSASWKNGWIWTQWAELPHAELVVRQGTIDVLTVSWSDESSLDLLSIKHVSAALSASRCDMSACKHHNNINNNNKKFEKAASYFMCCPHWFRVLMLFCCMTALSMRSQGLAFQLKNVVINLIFAIPEDHMLPRVKQ